ncbi:MAG: T9SS type A sorting domain-containing protein [Aureispira sp.]|nr:T9SS type A sorting domain-containing protein [Aureispira sp.]
MNIKSNYNRLILFLWVFGYSVFCKAQTSRFSAEVLRADSTTYLHAWAGGLNNPQFSTIDLNNNGQEDLIVFDRTGGVLLPFLNGGNSNTVDYTYAPEHISDFPILEKWLLLRDYNCDGLEDIFAYNYNVNTGQRGIQVHKARRLANTRVTFDLVQEILLFSQKGQSNTANLYVSTIDLPAIDDIDGDGDLDVLTFNTAGGYVELYSNHSQELGYNCDSLIYLYRDNCWGRFYESGASATLDLSSAIDSCWGYTNWQPVRNLRHAGSSLLTIDMDNDGDKELILGDLAFNNLNLLTNGGNKDTAFISNQEIYFPQNSQQVNIEVFPAAFHLDVNNDGKKDLIAAPNIDVSAINDKVAWWYQNTQNDANPSFNFQQNDFLVGNMIDVGSNAAPTFADINGDSLMDLVVGNYGYYQGSGNYKTQLVLFTNIGTKTQPKFRLTNTNLGNLEQYNIKRLMPTFGDLDADGDQDILVGQIDGTLLYLENKGSASNPSYTSLVPAYKGIDVGQHAAPQLIDVDRDGDLDLIIGEKNGNTNYFENSGTSTNPAFGNTQTSFTFGLIDAKLTGFTEGNSVPHIVDIGGVYHLLMGNEQGSVWAYNNIENNLSGAFTQLGMLSDLDEGTESTVATADLDNDGVLEVVVGNKRGGLSLFTISNPSSTKTIKENSSTMVKVYPNPSQYIINIELLDKQTTTMNLSLYNVLGQVLETKNQVSAQEVYQMDISGCKSGVYYLNVEYNGQVISKRFVVL